MPRHHCNDLANFVIPIQVHCIVAPHELKQMALELQDSQLMSRISGGDIITIEAKYHINCPVSYKNRYRSM